MAIKAWQIAALPAKMYCIIHGMRYISIKISLKFAPKGPINKYSNIDSDYGFAQARRKAIIWTNDV